MRRSRSASGGVTSSPTSRADLCRGTTPAVHSTTFLAWSASGGSSRSSAGNQMRAAIASCSRACWNSPLPSWEQHATCRRSHLPSRGVALGKEGNNMGTPDPGQQERVYIDQVVAYLRTHYRADTREIAALLGVDERDAATYVQAA